MTWMIAALLTVLAVGAARAGQTPSCEPPAGWGTSKAFADWRVGRACVAGTDTLSITAVAQADRTRALTLLCDEDGSGGMIMFRNLPTTGAVTMTRGAC